MTHRMSVEIFKLISAALRLAAAIWRLLLVNVIFVSFFVCFRVGAFFFIVMNYVFGNMSAVDIFIKERAVFMYVVDTFSLVAFLLCICQTHLFFLLLLFAKLAQRTTDIKV